MIFGETCSHLSALWGEYLQALLAASSASSDADAGAVAGLQMASRAWGGWCRRCARRPGTSLPAPTTARAVGSMPRSPGRSLSAGPPPAQTPCEPGAPRPACSHPAALFQGTASETPLLPCKQIQQRLNSYF